MLQPKYDFEFLKNESEIFVFEELERQLALIAKEKQAKIDLSNMAKGEDPAVIAESHAKDHAKEKMNEVESADNDAKEKLTQETVEGKSIHVHRHTNSTHKHTRNEAETGEEADDGEDMCFCTECVLDMAAMALNSVRPLYRVSLLGTLYAESAITEDKAYAESIKEAVFSAIEKVRKNPSH
jgi:competence protein ComFB